MIDVNRILEDLDKHASEFNFPVLDNANVEVADVRLTALRGQDAWAVFFDFVGFSPTEAQFVDDIYGYGTCVYPEGILGQRVPLSQSPKAPLWDAKDNECVADWSKWTVVIDGQERSFSPSIREYADAQITIAQPPGPGSIREVEILRFLVHRLGHLFFSSERELFELAPHCKNLSSFLVATEWRHPDVAGDEKPSQNSSIRSLVRAIAEGDPSIFDPSRPNTHWTHWVDVDA